MRIINVTSNTNAYVIIRNLNLKPGASGTIDVDILVLSELKSLRNLSLAGDIIISANDFNYIVDKIATISGEGTASYPSFIGNADKVLTVNATEDGVEWTTALTQTYVDTQDSLLQDQIDLKANAMATSQSLALKADLISGLIPASQLPSYVDDVLSFPDLVSFPSLGEDGKIYIAEDVNKTYRWGGSSYVEIGGGGVALGETFSTAYRGDRGKIAYDHSLSQGNPHNATTSDIPEGTRLYFTEDRVLQAALIGLNTTNPAPVTATDALLAAIGKLQAQINNSGGGSSVTWVSAASIGTTHPSFVNVQFAKIGGLLWIIGYCNNLAFMGAGTTLFSLTDPSYHLDIPNTSVFPIVLGEVKTFSLNLASKLIQLKNVVNNANKFSLHNSTIFPTNEYNQIQPVCIGKLLTP